MFFFIDSKKCKGLDAKIQAPFVNAEIRALRTSIFKSSPEVQLALGIATKIEEKYNLNNPELFIPALETFCAILEPLSGSLLSGTVRRAGYEIFPQLVAILGLTRENVKAAMGLREPSDVVRAVSDRYKECVTGSDAGALTYQSTPTGIIVTDTAIVPCQLNIGVYMGAGKFTGLYRDNAVVEKKCRGKGDSACTYEFTFS
jgi:hypothetical protein